MVFPFFRRLWAASQRGRCRRCTPDQRQTLLLISSRMSERDTVRVFALLHGWRLLVASDLRAAIELLQWEHVTVICYDQDVPGVEWSEGVRRLLETKPPVCLVLLSFAPDDKLRFELLAAGGYDVAPRPLTLETLASLVHGAVTLIHDVDSAERHLFPNSPGRPPWQGMKSSGSTGGNGLTPDGLRMSPDLPRDR